MDAKLKLLKEACMYEMAVAEQQIRQGDVNDGILNLRSTVLTLLDHVVQSTQLHSKKKSKDKANLVEKQSKSPDEEQDFPSLIHTNKRIFDEPIPWDTVVGQLEAKLALKEALEYPLLFDWYFKKNNVSVQGVLLYGPPGVAKSKLAEVAASNSKATYIELPASSVKSKYFGESEKLLKDLFSFIKSNKRTVVFVDEIDGMFPSRGDSDKKMGDGIVNEFLINMRGNDNTEKGWFVIIGATNFPQNIDAAVLRRFQTQIRLRMPEEADRRTLIAQLLGSHIQDFTEPDLTCFGQLTEGFSGSDIHTVMKNVLLIPLRKGLLDANVDKNSTAFRDLVFKIKITKDEVALCIKTHKKTVSKAILEALDRFEQAEMTSCMETGSHATKRLTIAKRISSWF